MSMCGKEAGESTSLLHSGSNGTQQQQQQQQAETPAQDTHTAPAENDLSDKRASIQGSSISTSSDAGTERRSVQTNAREDDRMTMDTQSQHGESHHRIRMRRKEIVFTSSVPESVWSSIETNEILQGRDVRPTLHDTHHKFTHNEIKKMCKTNESIESRHPHNLVYRNYLARKQPKWNHWKKGILFMVIGMVMGLVGLFMFQSIAFFSDHRKDWLADRVSDAVRRHKQDKSYVGTYVVAYFEWLCSGTFLIVVSMLLVKWQPPAGGSGVTDVMAYLNGVLFEKVFNIRTLFAKGLSCIAAVSSGLPVGPEGPMIHIGAILGAGIGSGRSKSLKFSLNAFFSSIRNPRDHLDSITGGAAAGVAVAFGAPIGGLLFVSEEVATHWYPALTPLIFAASLTACFTFGVFASQLEGWELRHETSFGGLIDEATILFYTEADRYMYARDLLSAAVIGATCSLFAVVFTKANLAIAKRRLKAPRSYRMVEPIVTLLVYLTVAFVVPLSMPCEQMPEDGSSDELKGAGLLSNSAANATQHMFIGAPCDDPGMFSASASLFWNPGETVIKLLFRKHNIMNPGSLVLFVLIYFVFSCFSCGMMISSGIVIPMLITGGGIGRLFGRVITQYIDTTQHEGVYAIIGAAGYFAGVSRLTVSLAVIMIELTSAKRCLLPIMVSVMVSKLVADRFGHSLYHGLLELRCVPFLDPSNLEEMNANHLTCFRVIDVAAPRVACVRESETVSYLINLLKGCSHQGFPVVRPDPDTGGLRYMGLVSRTQLYTLLWHLEESYCEEYGAVLNSDVCLNWEELERLAEKKFINNQKQPACLRDEWEAGCEPLDAAGSAPPAPSCADRKLLPHHLEIDMRMFADTSCVTVQPSVAVPVAFQLFTSMGLRHMPVVNEYGHLVGIITRKDLLACRLQRRMIESIGQQRHVSEQQVEQLSDDDWDIIDYNPNHTARVFF